MAGILSAWRTVALNECGLLVPQGELSPALVLLATGNTIPGRKPPELCTPGTETCGEKKKTYRRHPIWFSGKFFPQRQGTFLENRGESWLGGLRTHGYSGPPSMGRNRLGYVTHASFYPRPFLWWCPFQNPEKRPGSPALQSQKHALHAPGDLAARSWNTRGIRILEILGIVVPHWERLG